jgi:DNA-binding winged helix-turn-helix (wHTH) protein
MSHLSNRIYEFGPYQLDAAERFLLRNGETIPLQPKAYL